jgi:hypothetical protein
MILRENQMKLYNKTILLAALFLITFINPGHSKTITQGNLNIEKLASSINGDLHEYTLKKDQFVSSIKSTQKGIAKLKNTYKQADTDKKKIMIKARTLKETSRLLGLYSRFYNLNIEKIRSILPKLDSLRQEARKSPSAKTANLLHNKEFKNNISTLYGNISAFALKFSKGKDKRDISTLLKENELLYRAGQKGINNFNNIISNVDKLSDYLRAIYAKTQLRSNILEQKKDQTEMAIKLMRFALALKPMQKTLIEMNPQGIIDVPDLDYSELIDPIINESESKVTIGIKDIYNDPGIDSELKAYEHGPGFIKRRK